MTAIGGIDHLVIAVTDLDCAEAAYRRLGFTLSPRAQHSEQMGTANHTIMLQDDYFELLGVRAPTDSNQRWRNALSQGEGLAGMAVQTSGAPAAQAAWRAQGFTPSDVRAFSRVVDRPGGIKMDAKFEIVSLPNGTLPGASIFACAQLTRDAVWLPELMTHPNTACAIRKFTVATPNPSSAAEDWRRALPSAKQSAIKGGVQIAMMRNTIEFIDAATAEKQYGAADQAVRSRAIAIEFAVVDMAACHAVLDQAGLSMRQNGEQILVSAQDACGVNLRFVSR